MISIITSFKRYMNENWRLQNTIFPQFAKFEGREEENGKDVHCYILNDVYKA